MNWCNVYIFTYEFKKLQGSLTTHDRDAFDHSSLSKIFTGIFKMFQNFGEAIEKPYKVFYTVEMCRGKRMIIP